MTMSEKILELLKKNLSGISGEMIASDLNVSRNTVWKVIEELRTRVRALSTRKVPEPQKGSYIWVSG